MKFDMAVLAAAINCSGMRYFHFFATKYPHNLHMKKSALNLALLSFSIAVSMFALSQSYAAESTCYGSVGNGRLEGGVKLPVSGNNFSAYSVAGATLGRTYVHSKVSDIVIAAYQSLENTHPKNQYVYGETGWAEGGRLKPHRTHQNGLSVDFFVPVKNAQGQSVPIPTSAPTRFGYDLEFDVNARLDEYQIDFEALGQHLYELHRAALSRKANIALVILDVRYHSKLFATTRGTYLKRNLKFMKKDAWVRHDEHYHIDFAVACKPIA